MENLQMLKFFFSALLAAALALSLPAAVDAQTTDTPKAAKKAKSETKSETKAETKSDAKSDAKGSKPLTAQQQKMKECGAKWQDEKKAKGVKGKEAYQKFLSGCLKG